MTRLTSQKLCAGFVGLWLVFSVITTPTYAQSFPIPSFDRDQKCASITFVHHEVFEVGMNVSRNMRPRLNAPASGCLRSPFQLTGQLPFHWLDKELGYVVLLDKANNLLAETTLTIGPPPHDNEYINVQGVLEFDLPTNLVDTPARLMVIKPNLTGDPAYDAALTITLIFADPR